MSASIDNITLYSPDGREVDVRNLVIPKPGGLPPLLPIDTDCKSHEITASPLFSNEATVIIDTEHNTLKVTDGVNEILFNPKTDEICIGNPTPAQITICFTMQDSTSFSISFLIDEMPPELEQCLFKIQVGK